MWAEPEGCVTNPQIGGQSPSSASPGPRPSEAGAGWALQRTAVRLRQWNPEGLLQGDRPEEARRVGWLRSAAGPKASGVLWFGSVDRFLSPNATPLLCAENVGCIGVKLLTALPGSEEGMSGARTGC